MGLPIKPLACGTVTVNGEQVPYRSLSRSEALRIGSWDKADADAAEVFILARACDVSEEDAIAFRDGTDYGTVSELLDAILETSGLSKKAGQPDPKAKSSVS